LSIENQEEKVKKITERKGEKVSKLIQQEVISYQQVQQFEREENSSIIAEINKLQGKLEVQEEENEYWRKNSTIARLVSVREDQLSNVSLSNLVNQLKKEPTQVKENQEIFEKIKGLLVVKEIFLNMRQTTIRGLQNCYNKKCVGISTANKTTKIIEEVISFVNFLAPEFLKKTVEVIKNSFQKKFSDRHVDEFKELLVNDEENLLLLNKDIIDKIYNPLSKLGLKFRLENDEPILFNGRYKIFEIENDI